MLYLAYLCRKLILGRLNIYIQNMNLLIYKTLDELTEDFADYIIKIAEMSIEANNRFNFVLTGGNSPKKLYQYLATTCAHRIDWEKVYFFFGDERYVPADHQDYNGLMAKTTLFDILGTKTDHIFYVDTTQTPEMAAINYRKAIDAHFNGEDVCFDLILLGMGDDAHTASIFPETSLIYEEEPTIKSIYVDKLKSNRISFTAPLINKAEHVAFLVYGENKADAIKHVIGDEEKNYEKYPAQLIHPVDGKLTFFVDTEAVSLLEN